MDVDSISLNFSPLDEYFMYIFLSLLNSFHSQSSSGVISILADCKYFNAISEYTNSVSVSLEYSPELGL
ncbi:hypothetical protein D3C80_2084270 [compost metagenome]